jgi:hypothetical protein
MANESVPVKEEKPVAPAEVAPVVAIALIDTTRGDLPREVHVYGPGENETHVFIPAKKITD